MDVTSIIKTVIEVIIGLLGVLITTKLVPWLKSKLSENQLDIVKQLVTAAVHAAEQMYVSGEGQAKLEYAIEVVNKALSDKNIKIDSEVLRSYIEAEVLKINKGE